MQSAAPPTPTQTNQPVSVTDTARASEGTGAVTDGRSWRRERTREHAARKRETTAATGSRLAIDWTACDGRGWCVELLPELLTQDRWGYPIQRERAAGATAAPTRPMAEITVPARLAAHAHRAVDICPRLALRLRHIC
jgi:ferredoxin